MVVEIRLNYNWQDISDSIIQPITIDRRVDEVLDSGTFTFVSKDIEYNIPPLTLCRVDGEYWLCSSECNEVIPSSPKEYNHNVSLIELTYYLQCYIVGTKVMSNTGIMYPTNADKCKVLCNIVNNKYELIFGVDYQKFKFASDAFSDSRWQLEREFMFGSGTTLFQALLDIGRTCNAIPRIIKVPLEFIPKASGDYLLQCQDGSGTGIDSFTDITKLDLQTIYDDANHEIGGITEDEMVTFTFVFNDNYYKLSDLNISISGVQTIKLVDLDGEEFETNVSYGQKQISINSDKLCKAILITAIPLNFISTKPIMEIEIIAEDSYIIDWDLLDNNSIFHLDSTKVLTRQFRQSVDDYTAILESEVNDVVDRTNTSKINYLSVRSEDYVINDDNQVLILPTRVERVVKLEINFSKYGYFIGDVTSYVDYSRIGTNIGKFSKFVLEEDCESAGDFAANTWASFFPKETRDYYNNICKYLKQHHPLMYNSNWLFGGSYDENVGKTSYFFVWSETQSGIKTFDLSEIIIEKNQYDLLETLEKTKYCYYTYNDDVIRGIYEYTHDDFWGSIMLDKKHPMLYYVLNSALKREIEVIEGELLFYIGLPYDFNKMTFTSLSINPRDYTFNIEYIPISSLYLLSENNKTSFNFEYEIKPTSRSFELSSSMSDFDLLVDSINKNNKMLGMPECSIQYFGKDYPKPSNLIDVAGIYHYVSSVQTTITFDKYVSVVNLVKEYNKIAEVFGVKTQFESTKLPLNNIIDRIVYCGEFNVTNGNVNGFQLIDFNYGRFNLFKQGVLFEKDECTYLVVEAVDNYCFDFQNNNNANLNDKVTENKQIPYADTNNECESFYIRAGFLNSNISLANSKSLPKYDSTYITLNGSTQKIIVYKDARERLIFVGKLKY